MNPEKQTFLQKLKDMVTLTGTQTFKRQPVPAPAIMPLDKTKFLAAIGAVETGGLRVDPYKYSRPSGRKDLGRALGKYQVTEGELKTYGSKYLGAPITPNQFLASTTAQDNYVLNKANTLLNQGYTPQDIADIHNQGITKSFPAGSGQYQSPDYVNKFNQIYNATTTGSQARP